ncbi:type I glyceraldehyde-3-phosphate dehydrogenase [Aliifodinibius sp. S!AR15-10]|uniref:type I glyceraldehyde-3-phosphate dehydrogenase n=1 Tax=Aliifodinibius sp. S!AR15-10 TaxID=2950437 RepID=UPI0028600DC9|nr:type I glyceraldehyde-3-phosphate dehydrogenase [Aliifodinibius sp. S!AR15-10]MDR8392265.1 type I glyceraldehyde-3-phosphate dehydrogenase [Aliifodinibius sp. S!AR15-10]
MAKTKVGINGFGRIGRLVTRSILAYHQDEIEIVGINDLTDAKTLAHLFKYDSVHGTYNGEVSSTDSSLTIDGMEIGISSERDPANLGWDKRGAEVVVESTGLFRNKEDASKHIEAGAEKVIISAPARGGDVKTIVLGVNDEEIDDETQVYSNASCTTNCLAPMVKVLDDNFGLEKGFMTTIHAYTSSQQIVDGPHKDLRRGRTAAHNIVPTTTGAAKAVGLVLPHLDGKLDGSAVRVPVPDGSLTDLTAVLEKNVSVEDIHNAYKEAAEGPMKGVLQYSEEELVSTDILGNPHSCIYDTGFTKVEGNLVKLLGWYDNEAGYSARTADLITKIS